jgi:GT2 family glycosyltransferase/peptidoglycan/xylan/chitin deacetylase (PgdA/CDA1 family)
MRLSIVIATYNRRHLLARTLPTVLAQSWPAEDREVVVVDDGSTDRTVDLLGSFAATGRLRFLAQPNRGPAAARNAGLRVARGPLILFLDDDILCDPGLVAAHVAAHRDGLVRLVFGPIFVAPESGRSLAVAWTRRYTDDYIGRLTREGVARPERDAFVDANSSIPRQTVLALGGFDERFGRQGETADLGLRLWASGVPFVFEPGAVVHHIFEKSVADLVHTDARLLGRSELLLCEKHPALRARSPLGALGDGPLPRRLARRAAARLPLSPDPLLAAGCLVAERLRSAPGAERLGVALLQARQGVELYRRAREQVGSWRALDRRFGLAVPALLYHHVGPAPRGRRPALSISPRQFERQIAWLARAGYVGIRPSEWLAWRSGSASLPDRPVLITFDDGYADTAAWALPILRRHGFGAAVYVVTGELAGTNRWDRPGRDELALLSADQVRHWAAQGIEFGAHTRRHVDLLTVSESRARDELVGSRDDLARILGLAVASFAYPYGRWDAATLAGARASFELAFTVEEGLNSLWTDPHLLRRTMVQPCDTILDLASRLTLGWSPLSRLRARAGRLRRAMSDE